MQYQRWHRAIESSSGSRSRWYRSEWWSWKCEWRTFASFDSCCDVKRTWRNDRWYVDTALFCLSSHGRQSCRSRSAKTMAFCVLLDVCVTLIKSPRQSYVRNKDCRRGLKISVLLWVCLEYLLSFRFNIVSRSSPILNSLLSEFYRVSRMKWRKSSTVRSVKIVRKIWPIETNESLHRLSSYNNTYCKIDIIKSTQLLDIHNVEKFNVNQNISKATPSTVY